MEINKGDKYILGEPYPGKRRISKTAGMNIAGRIGRCADGWTGLPQLEPRLCESEKCRPHPITMKDSTGTGPGRPYHKK